MPVSLADWKSYDVPGVVGILRKGATGQFELVDAFDCDTIPSASDLARHEKFSQWVSLAGSHDQVRFDVFLMPQAEPKRRREIVTIIERGCGLHLPDAPIYVNAA